MGVDVPWGPNRVHGGSEEFELSWASQTASEERPRPTEPQASKSRKRVYGGKPAATAPRDLRKGLGRFAVEAVSELYGFELLVGCRQIGPLVSNQHRENERAR